MQTFMQALRTQRWDDHRYYHHSRINQCLHLLSAISFVVAYSWPSRAGGGGVDRLARRDGEPAVRAFLLRAEGLHSLNQATHAHKEQIKVGYNLRRKVVLQSIWAISPLILWFEPTLFGVFAPPADTAEFVHHVGIVWLAIGVGGLLLRTVHLSSSATCRPAWCGSPRF